VAKTLKLKDPLLEQIAWAAMSHDIGKLHPALHKRYYGPKNKFKVFSVLTRERSRWLHSLVGCQIIRNAQMPESLRPLTILTTAWMHYLGQPHMAKRLMSRVYEQEVPVLSPKQKLAVHIVSATDNLLGRLENRGHRTPQNHVEALGQLAHEGFYDRRVLQALGQVAISKL
jgi:hypothetical protein